MLTNDLDQDKGLLEDEVYTRPAIESPNLSQDEEDQIRNILEGARGRVKRTHSYYEKLRKENPNQYWKTETQTQLYKDAEALGDAYKDGEYFKRGKDFY